MVRVTTWCCFKRNWCMQWNSCFAWNYSEPLSRESQKENFKIFENEIIEWNWWISEHNIFSSSFEEVLWNVQGILAENYSENYQFHKSIHEGYINIEIFSRWHQLGTIWPQTRLLERVLIYQTCTNRKTAVAVPSKFRCRKIWPWEKVAQRWREFPIRGIEYVMPRIQNRSPLQLEKLFETMHNPYQGLFGSFESLLSRKFR